MTRGARARRVEFVGSAATLAQVPADGLPEVAFIGPSNVGKSSLVNALVGRRGLARTSKTPGRTQLLNFFRVDASFHLVDLPGYGYAKAPKDVRERFVRLAEEYLDRPGRLALVVLLVDCRREPSARETDLAAWIAERSPLAVVLTKADKISRSQLERREAETLAAFGPVPLVSFSATDGRGRAELWKLIDAAVGERLASAASAGRRR